MNNFKLTVEVETAYQEMKDLEKYSWIIMEMQYSTWTLEIESKAKGTYEEFEAALTASDEPRVAIYRTPKDWIMGQRLILIFW